MASMNLSSREGDGRAVVALHGELNVADAASIVAALTAVAARARELAVDVAGLEFIDCSGLAAPVVARDQARRAVGDLLLAAPQDQVLRVPAATRLTGVFAVHASVGQAMDSTGRSPLVAGPVP